MSHRGDAQVGCADFTAACAPIAAVFSKPASSAAGLSLGQLLRSEARAASDTGRKPSVIILWMRGGPSHLDMWDPKPDAPAEIRGEFGTIPTKLSGVRLCDLLPLCAGMLDKWSIVRSLHHEDAA